MPDLHKAAAGLEGVIEAVNHQFVVMSLGSFNNNLITDKG